jgi:hypothetical protein
MTQRTVTGISVGIDGQVVRLYHDGQPWSPIGSADALLDLELGLHSYCVKWPEGTFQIMDSTDGNLKYLTAERDGPGQNSLLSLPRR